MKLGGNGLQTNGLLIDQEWAEFLSEYKFLIGLSLGGYEHIHNRYRLTRNGKRSWSQVVDKAKIAAAARKWPPMLSP